MLCLTCRAPQHAGVFGDRHVDSADDTRALDNLEYGEAYRAWQAHKRVLGVVEWSELPMFLNSAVAPGSIHPEVQLVAFYTASAATCNVTVSVVDRYCAACVATTSMSLLMISPTCRSG